MSTKKPTILLVDDDPAMLRMRSRVLKGDGFRVVTAHDSAAVPELAARERSLALVILESEAACQEGIEVCRRLREFSDVPVIVVAENCGVYDIVSGLEAGADDFIPKPVGIVEFTARVKTVLQRAG